MSRLQALLSVVAMATLPTAAAAQQPASAAGEHPTVMTAGDMKWNPLELPGFRPGLVLAVLQGDPSRPQVPYTVRLKFPDGYVFPAHYHPNAENLTVVSGKFLIGHGARPSDAELKEYVPGDYMFIPGKSPHFGRVSGETVVQLHGIGPFEVLLADPGMKTSK